MNLATSCVTDAVDVSPAIGTKHMHEFENPRTTSHPVLTLADLVAFDPGSRAGPKERRFCCPLPACAEKPRDNLHRSLSLESSTGLWHCFRCGASGQVREAWTTSSPRSTPSSATRTTGSAAHVAERNNDRAWQGHWRRAGEVRRTLGAEYLESRGIAETIAAAAGVRFAGRYFGRPAVLFPLVAEDRAMLAVHGRYIDGEEPRMRTAGRKSEALFATVGALSATEVAVTEAPIDALSLASLGLPAVALCGTSWPSWLLTHLQGKTVRAAFDADKAGDCAAADLVDALSEQGTECTRLRPAGAKDWNEGLRDGPTLPFLISNGYPGSQSKGYEPR